MASDKNSILSAVPLVSVAGVRPSTTRAGVEHYVEFSDFVWERAEAFLQDTCARNELLLDGEAGRAVERLIDRETRARHGIFFSGHVLAERAATYLKEQIASGHAVYDPTCGAGDLLIQAAKMMPIRSSVHETLQDWGARLYGTDLHEVFVETARRRLTLLALYRHGSSQATVSLVNGLRNYFPGLRVGDYLSSDCRPPAPCCYLMNPPFVTELAPGWVTWSTGRIQMAGAFLELAIRNALPGEHISAILPDVLRSGTRYARWRDAIAALAEVSLVEPYGRFDSATDVDVFVVHIVKPEGSGHQCARWPSIKRKALPARVPLSNLASVSVGAVVPHRHGNRGPWRCYLAVANAPAFGETTVRLKRRFSGTVVTPPFLVVRRTSNPSDKDRLITTIVVGDEPVAVENHLIVIKPHGESVAECRKIAKALSDTAARQWLDETIRCRHLTTKVLKDIPLSLGNV
ncbi:SAM-dependent methyltransferase [Burkholderia glumae]|uniref:SAM-dependent methyltransferase n=1 Tax=Burkholderia glumae TaxID=337 RepID=UPI002036ED11|nr:SAM-dependent methyltransferase [Burkholderia glumae]MCM2496033.1 SAM-dependent methyltransferase [Burkholderia glumae]